MEANVSKLDNLKAKQDNCDSRIDRAAQLPKSSNKALNRAQAATGNCRVNCAPPSGASATETVPLSACMIRRTIASPNPAPSLPDCPRQKRWKIFSRIEG